MPSDVVSPAAPTGPASPPAGALPASRPALEAARRVGESLVVAAVGSTGLYLVGSVYTDSYYGRLSVEPSSLDLAPPFIALQAVHALGGLLEYPSTLLFYWVLYRALAPRARRLRGWVGRARARFPRHLLVLANLAVVAPLVGGAFLTSFREQAMAPNSVLTEVAGVLGGAGGILLLYAAWLGWGQRASLVAQVRARRLLPIALVFLVYLLNALASTAAVAENAAVLLMTGESDGSMGIAFAAKAGVPAPAAGKDLVLVTARNGAFYAVERQPDPPSQRPVAYVVPFTSVEAARVQRLNDADATFGDLVLDDVLDDMVAE